MRRLRDSLKGLKLYPPANRLERTTACSTSTPPLAQDCAVPSPVHQSFSRFSGTWSPVLDYEFCYQRSSSSLLCWGDVTLQPLELTQRPLPRKEWPHRIVCLGLNSEASSPWRRAGTSVGLAGELNCGAKYYTAVQGQWGHTGWDNWEKKNLPSGQ